MENCQECICVLEGVEKELKKHRKFKHEWNNHLMCIYYLEMLDKRSELRSYINFLCEESQKDIIRITNYSGHCITDIILSQKKKEAMSKGISFHIKTCNLSHLSISGGNMVVILSNVLTNAIEAAVKCIKEKKIVIDIIRLGNDIKIHVKNTHCNQIREQKRGIVSSKNLNRREHGYGLLNVIDAVENVGGTCIISWTCDDFSIDLSLPECFDEKEHF